MAQQTPRNVDHWQDVFRKGDKDGFHELAENEMRALLDAARHDLDFYVRRGYLHGDDFTPEEVAGQALIYAWDHREQCPDKMSLRGWLLGTQYRVLRTMVAGEREYRDEKQISLDEELPSDDPTDAIQEQFWEWYQPDDELFWEDTLADRLPEDVEVDLEEYKKVAVEGDSDAWHVLVMHDEFDMTLPEVAVTMNRSVNGVAEMLQRARASIRERIPQRPHISEMDQPAPPLGSDEEDLP